ncbi:hypothetical protein [Bacillus niameyensis]|uniref:hypothetical protein n=1 Tax=Bacillus niameyensis TaxID=1522308 RepID=UPI0007832C0D|nr:hypothetical protein [Bacillus niameyensis]
MDNESFIRKGLHLQGLPSYEKDVPYIEDILKTMKIAENSLQAYPYLNMEVPIMVVDKELMR